MGFPCFLDSLSPVSSQLKYGVRKKKKNCQAEVHTCFTVEVTDFIDMVYVLTCFLPLYFPPVLHGNITLDLIVGAEGPNFLGEHAGKIPLLCPEIHCI